MSTSHDEGALDGSELPSLQNGSRKSLISKIAAISFLKGLEKGRKFTIDVVIIGIGIVLAFTIWKEVRQEVVVIEPFTIPKEFEARGLTGDGIAQRLADKVHDIYRGSLLSRESVSTWGYTERLNVGASRNEVLNKVQIPESGMTLQTVVTLLRNHLGPADTQVGGDLTLEVAGLPWAAPPSFSLLLRFKRNNKRFAESLASDNFDQLIEKAALKFLERVDPYGLALHHTVRNSGPSWTYRSIPSSLIRDPPTAKGPTTCAVYIIKISTIKLIQPQKLIQPHTLSFWKRSKTTNKRLRSIHTIPAPTSIWAMR